MALPAQRRSPRGEPAFFSPIHNYYTMHTTIGYIIPVAVFKCQYFLGVTNCYKSKFIIEVHTVE